MTPSTPEVKSRRRYDAAGRRAAAGRSRELMVAAAHDLFLGAGYAGTTIADVAGRAGVSSESVYKAFGNKPGLVRAVRERALLGAGVTPAELRSDRFAELAPDGEAVMRQWGRLSAEVAPRVAPILLLVRAAAAQDASMAALHDELTESRLERMRRNAVRLSERGFLRADLPVEQAAEVMLVLTAPELYETLVLRQGWSLSRFGDFVATSLVAHLLGDD